MARVITELWDRKALLEPELNAELQQVRDPDLVHKEEMEHILKRARALAAQLADPERPSTEAPVQEDRFQELLTLGHEVREKEKDYQRRRPEAIESHAMIKRRMKIIFLLQQLEKIGNEISEPIEAWLQLATALKKSTKESSQQHTKTAKDVQAATGIIVSPTNQHESRCSASQAPMGIDANLIVETAKENSPQSERPQSHQPQVSPAHEHHPSHNHRLTSLDGSEVSNPSKRKRISETRSRSASRQNTRTIEFHSVYQDGKAARKYIIVEYPKGETEERLKTWYILRCDRHGVYFGERPIAGAAKHLDSAAHGNMSKAHDIAITELGIKVLNCNTELAETNNGVVRKAFANGYRLPKASRRHTDEGDADYASHLSATSLYEIDTSIGPTRQAPLTLEPLAGHHYCIYWERTKRYFAGVVLPGEGDCSVVRMTASIYDMDDLMKDLPECYDMASIGDQKLQWAEGYRNGQALVQERLYPVIYFDQDRTFPKNCGIGWAHVRNFADYNPELLPVSEQEAVRDWKKAQAPGAGSVNMGMDSDDQQEALDCDTPMNEDLFGEATYIANEPEIQEAQHHGTVPVVVANENSAVNTLDFLSQSHQSHYAMEETRDIGGQVAGTEDSWALSAMPGECSAGPSGHPKPKQEDLARMAFLQSYLNSGGVS